MMNCFVDCDCIVAFINIIPIEMVEFEIECFYFFN